MADLTPEQEATRGRVEGLIALAAPFLDVVLGIGERISRIAEPTDHEYYPINPGTEAGELAGQEEAEVVDASAEEIPIEDDQP